MRTANPQFSDGAAHAPAHSRVSLRRVPIHLSFSIAVLGTPAIRGQRNFEYAPYRAYLSGALTAGVECPSCRCGAALAHRRHMKSKKCL
jgi:hypothetical protein